MLLKILAGIIKADFGTIFIDGKEFSPDDSQTRRKICYIPEYIDFDKNLSVFENLLIYMKLYTNITHNDICNAIFHWADIFNFMDLLETSISDIQISRLKMIHLSRAFLHNPEILILDQPTKELDLENQILFWEKIGTVLRNTTIIYSSHNFNEIEEYSNRVAFLDNGKIRLNGSIEEIMNQTKTYSYYKIMFKDAVNDSFKEKLKENSYCYHLNIGSKEVEFYSPDKESSISLIQTAFNYNVKDFIERPFSFKDIFLTQIKKTK